MGALAFFFVVPAAYEQFVNRARKGPPYAASERARSLHGRLFVADMHADGTLSSLSKKWYNGVDWTVTSASKGSVSASPSA